MNIILPFTSSSERTQSLPPHSPWLAPSFAPSPSVGLASSPVSSPPEKQKTNIRGWTVTWTKYEQDKPVIPCVSSSSILPLLLSLLVLAANPCNAACKQKLTNYVTWNIRNTEKEWYKYKGFSSKRVILSRTGTSAYHSGCLKKPCNFFRKTNVQ